MKKPIQFGKYFLLERVNVGGMAEVFKAKALGVEGFERMLAVKRILPNIAEDKEFITMFIDEAKIAVQLNHANIAQIFDLGKVEDSYFIALEYVAGKDLRALFDRCRQRPENGQVVMPIAQACFVTMKVCEGLDYAHNKRDAGGKELHLVHRDVSPQNVLISFDGEVKLIDFGIAKAAGKAGKTQAGILKGKFGYMSPEQVRGLPLDRRSDVFSVGIVLYELLTGERLFVGESDFSTLEKVRNVEILPPSAYNRKIPEDLERIVLKALAKDVEDRYQSAIDLHDDLQAFMYTGGEFYSRKELTAWMKRLFADEIAGERQRDEAWRGVDLAAAAAGQLSGQASAAPAKAARAQPRAQPVAAPAPPAAEADDLNWDDDELETHVYDAAPTEEEATVLDAEAEDDDSIPDLAHVELSLDGAPVPARRPAEAPPARRTTLPPPSVEDGARSARPTPAAAPAAAREAPLALVADEPRAAARPTPGPQKAVAAPARPPRTTEPATPTATAAMAAGASPAPAATPAAPPAGPVVAPTPPSRSAGGVRPSQPATKAVQAAAPNLPLPLPLPPTLTVPAIGEYSDRRKRGSATWMAAGVGAVAVIVLGASFAMRPTAGQIQLAVTPADGVRVFVDEQAVAAAELAHLERPPGPHAVRIERAGYKAWSDRLDVPPRQTVSRSVALEQLPRAGFAIAEPAGATVVLDGTAINGVTPFKADGLDPGRHRIDVKLGEQSWSQDVDLAPGAILDVKPVFAANPAVAALAARPSAPSTPSPPGDSAARGEGRASRRSRSADGEAPSSRALPALPSSPVAAAPPAPDPAPREPEPRAAAPAPSAPSAPSAGQGTLRLNSVPWTNIAVDGKSVGRTPQVDLRLAAGSHKVLLTNPQRGISEAFTVEVRAGETQTVKKVFKDPAVEEE